MVKMPPSSSFSVTSVARFFLALAIVLPRPGSCTPVLTRYTRLHIERNLVPSNVVQELYHKILETAVPGPRDNFHRSLIGFKSDAGIQEEGQSGMTNVERATKFRELLGNLNLTPRESGILRIEHLKLNDYHQTKNLINNVVANSILEDEGTIHLYVSRPNSAALANHTDPTDIFVLQLMGTKEWMFCEEKETFHLRNKLNKCATYDESEIGDLRCHREKLFPGDALYLPKRIVHSARATEQGPTAHLTFGFADTMCSTDDVEDHLPSSRKVEETSRVLQTCNLAEGGTECDGSCDEDCSSCDLGCNGSCDAYCFGTCTANCDSDCDDDCDSCESDCDELCDVCPGGATTRSPTSSPTKGTMAPTFAIANDACPELTIVQACSATRMSEMYDVRGVYYPFRGRCERDYRWDDSDMTSTVYRSDKTVDFSSRQVHIWMFRNGRAPNQWIVDWNLNDRCGGESEYAASEEMAASFAASGTQPHVDTDSVILCGDYNDGWVQTPTPFVLACNENAQIPTPATRPRPATNGGSDGGTRLLHIGSLSFWQKIVMTLTVILVQAF